MAAFGGRLMLKGGAEGVYCGALRDKGLGFAIKIDDGKNEAAELVAASLIAAISAPSGNEAAALAPWTGHMLAQCARDRSRCIPRHRVGATDDLKGYFLRRRTAVPTAVTISMALRLPIVS